MTLLAPASGRAPIHPTSSRAAPRAAATGLTRSPAVAIGHLDRGGGRMNMSRFARMAGLTGLLCIGASAEGWSQTTGGTVTGMVTDGGNSGPVSAAQVHIPQLQIGALTQANGRYLLVNVPAGAHEVRIERIGYRTETRQVTVAAGQAVEVNVGLTEDALSLDEIVVTGTAGQA